MDRLEKVKAVLEDVSPESEQGAYAIKYDVPWLISEVERLRNNKASMIKYEIQMEDEISKLKAEVERLWGNEKEAAGALHRLAKELSLVDEGPDENVNGAIAIVEALKEKYDEAVEYVIDMVSQACTVSGDDNWRDQDGKALPLGQHLDSMALSAYAEAMIYLAELGKIKLDGEPVGKRVIGRWKEKKP